MLETEKSDSKEMEESNAQPSVNHAKILSKIRRFYQVFFLSMIVITLASFVSPRSNATLDNRSVQTTTSLPSAVANHTFDFSILTGIPMIGSIAFEYCSNTPLPDMPCTAPTGLDVTGAALVNQLGEIGFTMHPNTTSNRIVITRAPSFVAVPGPVTYGFDDITNPDGTSPTVFVRIFIYATTDGTGLPGDTGSVSFSVQNPLTVTLYVPPYLALCSGVTVAPDCTTTTGSTVDLGELSKVAPTTGTTQFAVATNSINGYTASIEGSTMTAGNRVIASLPVQSASQGGVSQFGINLRANTIPAVGQNIAGTGTGSVSAQYNTPNQFKFVSGDVIATSSLPTDWNRYTISYMVNVADGQPAGRYATTMTVIATTTF